MSQDIGPVCLVRAGDGKKKLQCVVPMGDHVSVRPQRGRKRKRTYADMITDTIRIGEILGGNNLSQLRFHMDLFTVIKANTEALKKPKRTRTKKTKAA